MALHFLERQLLKLLDESRALRFVRHCGLSGIAELSASLFEFEVNTTLSQSLWCGSFAYTTLQIDA